MKTIYKLVFFIIAFNLVGCEREYDAPLLQPPVYNGEANVTIANLKQLYADVSAATLIEVDFVIRGYLTANDESGNIYKQLYIQDNTGAICLSVDQNSMYATFRVGQEVFVHLHGLYILRYGGELQIGYDDSSSNRVPWAIFTEHVFFNGYPDKANVSPQVVAISQLSEQHMHQLIRINDVRFENGGKKAFTTGGVTTNENIIDASGNVLAVRNSPYATFAEERLPIGEGSVIGILSRFNGAWQFYIRDMNDLLNFPDDDGGGNGNGNGDSDDIFKETFGTGTYNSQDTRKKIADFTDFDVKTVSYSDISGNADIRSTSALNAHVWLPANSDSYLTISGINTAGYSDLKLSFDMAANLYDVTGTFDLKDVITVSCNGNTLTMPSQTVTSSNSNTYFNFELSGIESGESLVIEFFASSTANTLGLRLDNIMITGNSE